MIFAVIAIGIVLAIVVLSLMAADLERRAEKLRSSLISEEVVTYDDTTVAQQSLSIIEMQARLQREILQREVSFIDIARKSFTHPTIRTETPKGATPELNQIAPNYLLGGQHGYYQQTRDTATDFKGCDASSDTQGFSGSDAGGVCGDLSQ